MFCLSEKIILYKLIYHNSHIGFEEREFLYVKKKKNCNRMVVKLYPMSFEILICLFLHY